MFDEIKQLRKDGVVIYTPQRIDHLVRMIEILATYATQMGIEEAIAIADEQAGEDRCLTR